MSIIPRCGKVCYKSRGDAKRFIKSRNKGHSDYKLTTAYYCEGCASYHVTSKSKSTRKDYKK